MRMKKTLYLLLAILSAVTMTACQKPADEVKGTVISVEEVKETGIQEEPADDGTDVAVEGVDDVITANFRESIYDLTKNEEMTLETRILLGKSTEGATFTRFLDNNDTVLRYNIIFYGEMGRLETDYYLTDSGVYYSCLDEDYNWPMYMENSEVWFRSLNQGLLKDGICYRYDDMKEEFRPSDQVKLPYYSLAEIESDFNQAEPDGIFDFSEYNIFSINGYLLGGYYQNKWINSTELYPLAAEVNRYKISFNGEYWGHVPGYKNFDPDQEQGFIGPRVDFPDQQYGNGKDLVTTLSTDSKNLVTAYSGYGDVRTVIGESLAVDSEIYQNALHDYLAAAGDQNTYELTHVMKADIDGDGQDEVFVQAYHTGEDPPYDSKGIIFMRKVVAGNVVTFTMPPSDPDNQGDFTLVRGFADLDGDGVGEILLSSSGIGYSGYLIYEFKDGVFAKILENEAFH